MVDQPANDRDTRIEVFFSSEYEEDAEKLVAAINRWFRNQDDDTEVSDIHYQNCITGNTVGGSFLVAVTYSKPR